MAIYVGQPLKGSDNNCTFMTLRFAKLPLGYIMMSLRVTLTFVFHIPSERLLKSRCLHCFRSPPQSICKNSFFSLT